MLYFTFRGIFYCLVNLFFPLALVHQVGLWVFGGVLNIDAVSAAILGLAVLLITGVVSWKECLSEGVAWDTLTWFAALIAMAGYLNKYGLISWFSETVVKVYFLLFSLLSPRLIFIVHERKPAFFKSLNLFQKYNLVFRYWKYTF